MKLKIDELIIIFDFIDKELVPQVNFEILINRPSYQKVYQKCETGSKDFKGVFCSALNYHMFVLPDGKVTICEQLYWDPRFIIGDLTKENILEVWNSNQAFHLANLQREDIRKESTCRSCKIFEDCFGARNRCWSDILKAYGRENWDYPDPRCKRSPAMVNDISFN
ncbi:MAG: SPASM domain-containing protein [Tannerellaceae bacterium]|nr:SPASM domain-containing protein [Tannerellaceae bacterium]